MAKPFLEIYLRDHFAGATGAVAMLGRLGRRAPDREHRLFFTALRTEIQEDRQTLRSVIRAIDSTPSVLRNVIARLTHHAARGKLRLSGPRADASVFLALETLALGIRGKIALWEALGTLAADDRRLRGFDFDDLRDRALRQYQHVDGERLALAPRVLAR